MATIVNVFVFSSLLATGFCALLVCPADHEIKPCHCTRAAFGIQVLCSNFDNSKDLVRAVHALREYKVHTLLLRQLNFSDVLPIDLFDDFTLKELRVQKSMLRFSQPAFSGLDSTLYTLDVAQDSVISTQDQFALAKLTKLNELSFQSNRLKIVHDKWLNEKVPNVHKVILDYNEISSIEKHAFASLNALSEISLSSNKIQEVSRSMFPRPAFKLAKIDLSFNQLKHLPNDIFAEMPFLNTIVLTENKLTSLRASTWKPVWDQLTSILLYDNPFNCNDEMNWIKDRRHKKDNDLKGECKLPSHLDGSTICEVYYT